VGSLDTVLLGPQARENSNKKKPASQKAGKFKPSWFSYNALPKQ